MGPRIGSCMTSFLFNVYPKCVRHSSRTDIYNCTTCMGAPIVQYTLKTTAPISYYYHIIQSINIIFQFDRKFWSVSLPTTSPCQMIVRHWAVFCFYCPSILNLLEFSKSVSVIKFNGTSTPKGSYRAITGDNGCNVNSSHYSLSTALCESIRYQAKSEQNVRQDLKHSLETGFYFEKSWYTLNTVNSIMFARNLFGEFRDHL